VSWFFYVVSCVDLSLYAGVTTAVSRRVHEHNETKRGAKYTRSRRPVRLVYSTGLESRSAALKLESKFKRLTRDNKINFLRERGVTIVG
jgi:putative endonuclease